ncbi:adenine deaminase [Paenibacillus campi]|uniref:adenine deaminase n=1 Tax=Paenibacillus campi TaxID=3106031 RepID=UPI002AFE9A74|nr:adenine deaminase [Paenibacillus sp. SGZ-1014]
MQWNQAALTRRIEVSAHTRPADLVIRGSKIVNVFSGEITEADIAIVDGVIAGIGSYTGTEVIDASGKWMIPGLIDGHVHIESSLLSPREFAKVVLQHGVTSVITDPHEIGSVAGAAGIRYMLEQSEGLPMDQFIMLPSCVPATSFESCAARLTAADLEAFYDHPRVLGLAEVMDYGALWQAEPGMVDKLVSAHTHGKRIDGHAAGIAADGIGVYAAAGIRTDHECINAEEAKQRLALGMYVMIREGTATKDLEAILPAVTPYNARRCVFVTDDKLTDDLLDEGSVDHNVRLAIRHGLPPVTAIQMATLNTAECFGLRDRGAIAPGYIADLVLLDDLEQLTIHSVYKNGQPVVTNRQLQPSAFPALASDRETDTSALSRCHMAAMHEHDLALPLHSELCNIIEIIPNSIVTRHTQERVDIVAGQFAPSIERDLLKLIVAERHRATGHIGRAIVKGFELQRGAIVSTVAHDSHNLIAAGASDEELLLAIRHVTELGGGLAVIDGDQVLASLPLAIGGLLSQLPYEQVYMQLARLREALRQIGAAQHYDPFLMLSFLALPVIPTLKLTDLGLFDFAAGRHIDVEVTYQPHSLPQT